MDRRGAKVFYVHIFRNNLLNVRITIHDFFAAECLFVRLKVFGCACVACSWHKRGQRKNKLIRSDVHAVKLLQ